MKDYLIAQRYASGLSAAIADESQLETVLASLRELGTLYETHHDFRTVLANPTIDINIRRRTLDEVLAKLASPAVLVRFAHVLLNRRRIALLPATAEVFASLTDERLNRVEAKVTSSIPLDAMQQQKITDSLTAFSGKKVWTTSEVDPDILGGVIARIGSTVIDGSLRARLEQLENALLSEEM